MVTLYGEIREQQDYNQKEGYKRKLQYKDHYFFKIKKKRTGPIFKQLSILPFDYIKKEAIASFMSRHFNNNLPSSFQ